jgi:hypothetical protein
VKYHRHKINIFLDSFVDIEKESSYHLLNFYDETIEKQAFILLFA